MANDFGDARNNRNDEFYTQWEDIEKEVMGYLDLDPDLFRGKVLLLPCDDPEWSNFTKFFAQNFQSLGLRKLISTSYAPDSRLFNEDATDWEKLSKNYREDYSKTRGRVFTLERDQNSDGVVNVEDLEWKYLEGDGDFRSPEVSRLRDEADMIVTNPPFSLFRDFAHWIIESKKSFLIIGNVNAVTYKDIFPAFKENRMWFGHSINSGDREFRVPESYPLNAAGSRTDTEGRKFIRVKGVRWFTNLDHGRRHSPLNLMSLEDNRRFSRRAVIRDVGYPEYDNYHAIDVSFTEAIPSDYLEPMGVPITFLDKYCPEQFEILDANDYRKPHQAAKSYALIKDADGSVNGVNKYARILIKHRR
jgi:hypothetical protein